MNSIYVVSTGIANTQELKPHDPRYRKATRNMILANDSIERALKNLPEFSLEDCGLVLGSCHGELDVTIDFLKTLGETGVARPILFQNSLHNSTAGFVSMFWKISGPMITVSRLHFTGEDALSTALSLLRANLCRVCLVTAVEARVAAIAEQLYGTKLRNQYVGEGGATVLLCNDQGLEQLKCDPICKINSVEVSQQGSASAMESANHYESDGIECFIRALEWQEREIYLPKPDGSRSLIQCHF